MKNKFFQFIILSVIILFIARGEQAIFYAKESLALCYEMIVPTLFPFFICSGLLIYSGFCDTLSKIFAPVMRPLFGVNPNGSAAFVLGIISGYPLGAVTVCNLYQGFYISKSEAERLLGFCNNSGPLFILGSVGIGLYSGLDVGLMLYSVHIAAAVLVGIIMRFYKKNSFIAPEAKITVNRSGVGAGFGDALESSVRSILNVCGAVVFFSVVSRLCLDFVSLREEYMALVTGICEFASGVMRTFELDVDFAAKMILSAVIVGFAGISVHIQVLAVVSKHELSMKPYLLGKLLHGIISGLLMWGILSASDIAVQNLPLNLSSGFMLNSLILTLLTASIFVVGIIASKHKKLQTDSEIL